MIPLHCRCTADTLPMCYRCDTKVSAKPRLRDKYGPLLENVTIPAVNAELTTATTVTTIVCNTTLRPCHPSRRDLLYRHLLRRRRSRLPTLPRADEALARRLHQHPNPLVPWLAQLLMNLPQDPLVLMTHPVNLLLSPLPRADEAVARRLHQHPNPLVPWLTQLLMDLPQDRVVLLMTPPVNLLLNPGPPQCPPKLQRAPTPPQCPPPPPPPLQLLPSPPRPRGRQGLKEH